MIFSKKRIKNILKSKNRNNTHKKINKRKKKNKKHNSFRKKKYNLRIKSIKKKKRKKRIAKKKKKAYIRKGGARLQIFYTSNKNNIESLVNHIETGGAGSKGYWSKYFPISYLDGSVSASSSVSSTATQTLEQGVSGTQTPQQGLPIGTQINQFDGVGRSSTRVDTRRYGDMKKIVGKLPETSCEPDMIKIGNKYAFWYKKPGNCSNIKEIYKKIAKNIQGESTDNNKLVTNLLYM